MKALLLVMSLMFATTIVNADVPYSTLKKQFTPFNQKVMQKLYKLEDVSATSDYATQEGHFQVRVAKVVFDVATDTGTIGTKSLGVYLPAKALMKQAWFYIDTQFVDAGSGTVAFQCEDSANIYAATDITGFAIGTVTSGVPTGTAANMVKSIAATCELQAVVAGAAQTAGKATLWVEYVVHL